MSTHFQFEREQFRVASDFKSELSLEEKSEAASIALCSRVVELLDSTDEQCLVLEASLDDCVQLDDMSELLRDQSDGFLSSEDFSSAAGARIIVYKRNFILFATTADWNAINRIFVKATDFEKLNEYVLTLKLAQ